MRAGTDATARPGRLMRILTSSSLAAAVLLSALAQAGDGRPGWSPGDPRLYPIRGNFRATIQRTTGGVPHIRAANLASAAFGHGYAQAQDNVCYLAEAFVKARSERAKYFGPGPGELGVNIISDFSYKAQRILSGAETEFPTLSPESKAMIKGFAEGYNLYIAETDPADLPPECRNQPWVKPISPVDLLAHYRIVGQYASGALFATGVTFLAVPPGVSPAPIIAASESAQDQDESQVAMLNGVVQTARSRAAEIEDFQDTGLASNAWGIGREMTEQGRGALLANPHFPYTGHRRLYQAHLNVPGYLNVNGAGLLGTAIPLISFNRNLAWSHTVSTSRRFTWYELELKPGDNLTYLKDGVEKPITRETFQIEVNLGGPEPVTLERTFYFSEYGPMLDANAVNDAFPVWGGPGVTTGKPAAYTYRDANADSPRFLDTWLEMSRARNLDEFQAVFEGCGSTLWTNTTYADDRGNAWYIDSSSVPNLSPTALAVVNAKRQASPLYAALFEQGITLLDGSTSRDDWVEGACGGRVPYAGKPKLLRSDWVQNSNDSYWATNPDQFLTGYSPLFGSERTPLNPRTRLGLSMLQNPLATGYADKAPAGQDGKFNAVDLIDVIYNNRTFYTDQFLDELLARCTLIGAAEVNLPEGSPRSVQQACDVLQGWDGVYNTDSVGAHLFRVFIANYRADFATDLTVPFDPADPVATPSTPSPEGRGTPDDTLLQALAKGLNALDSVSIAYDARLGDLQFYQPSGGVPPGGSPVELGASFPWHGGDGGIDGAFNAIGVATSETAEDTRFPRLAPTVIPNTAGLSEQPGEGWSIGRGTSWHFGVEFTHWGPQAYGLVSYAQSTDPASPYFNDQSLRYSEKQYRKLLFWQWEINANLEPNGVTRVSSPPNPHEQWKKWLDKWKGLFKHPIH